MKATCEIQHVWSLLLPRRRRTPSCAFGAAPSSSLPASPRPPCGPSCPQQQEEACSLLHSSQLLRQGQARQPHTQYMQLLCNGPLVSFVAEQVHAHPVRELYVDKAGTLFTASGALLAGSFFWQHVRSMIQYLLLMSLRDWPQHRTLFTHTMPLATPPVTTTYVTTQVAVICHSVAV
jgi:hypothetical protein